MLRGLDPLIQRLVNTISLDDFRAVLEMTQRAERCEEAISSRGLRDKGLIHESSHASGSSTS